MIPDNIKTHPAWHARDPVHHVASMIFPAAKEGDTCTCKFRLWLCIGRQRWKEIGPWSPVLGFRVASRARTVVAGGTAWRWREKPKSPAVGAMERLRG